MKILLICPYFPPEGEIAAIRIGKFAEYWSLSGHKVTVITRSPVTTETKKPNHENLTVLHAHDPMGNFHSTYKTAKTDFIFSRFATKVLAYLKKFVLIPDQFWLWSRNVIAEFSKVEFTPDVVVASGAPISAFVAGAKIANKAGVPFVADYRDLISSVKNYPLGFQRQRLDAAIEKKAVSQAALITAASSGCVENLKHLFTSDFLVIENGYEPSDYKGFSYTPIGSTLNVVYTGSVYCEESDLSPFFEAISNIQKSSPEIDIKLHYYGRSRSFSCINAWAKKYCVDHLVINHGMVSHHKVTEVQVNADILLLLMPFDSPENQWVLSGKYYEYLGARRPILQIGLESGELAERLRASGRGFVSSNPEAIQEFLVNAVSEKFKTSAADSSDFLNAEYTRQVQSLKMLDKLEEIVR